MDPNDDDAREAKLACTDEFNALLDAERAALEGDLDEEQVLEDIVWRDYPIVRLMLYSIRRDAQIDGLGPESHHLLRALCVKLPDEKNYQKTLTNMSAIVSALDATSTSG